MRYIQYCPTGRGLRAAVAYEKTNKAIIGYFNGYCGGGIQCDGYFRMGLDYKNVEIFDEGEDGFDERFYKLLDEAQEDFEFDEDWFWVLKSEVYEKFEKIGDEYVFGEDFDTNVLFALSKDWPLLTFFKQK